MVGWRLISGGLALALLAVSHASAALTLVDEGQPTSAIVIADQPTPSATQAATDLQMWLQRSTGATVPITQESRIDDDTKGVQILVGDTQRTRTLGVQQVALGLEEFVIQTHPNAIVIAGDDERPDGAPLTGTVLAVNRFVEDVLGVRMLWPGPLGEVVPTHRSVEIQELGVRQQPRLIGRHIGNHAFNGAIHAYLDALGWDRDDYQAFSEGANLWFRFHQLGGSHTGSYGHAFGTYWERFHESHPDWFAMQPNGTRDNQQPDSDGYPSHRLCVSNPELIRRVASEAIQHLRAHPTLDATSVSPNDGGLQTFCLCESCQAWDAPEGSIVQMRSKNGPIPHVSLTDRYVQFYSEIAKIVSQELPERYVGAYAYSLYTAAPVHAELHPGVMMGLVAGTKVYFDEAKREQLRDNWLKWSQKSRHLHAYSNGLMGIHALPTVVAHRMAEDMRFLAEHRMRHIYLDCHFHHWATNGLNYYVAAKLLWDPSIDVEDVIQEYCVAGFAESSQAIRKYFDALERISTAIAEERQRPNADTVARHFTDAALRSLNRLLDDAERTAGDDEVVIQRIAFLRTGLEYAPICRDYLVTQAASKVGNKWDWRRHMQATTRRITWYQQLGMSRAIHAPWLIYQDW